jgi:hypothetical protein
MATSTASLYPDSSTLANFKAWAQFISNAFSTFGWTAGTDTGQVDWGTIASVPTTYGTFEIWKSADALSSSTPITLRIDYAYYSSHAAVAIQIGTGGTDGAGNPLAPRSGAYWIHAYNNTTAVYMTCYASGGTNGFRCLMFATGGNTAFPYYNEPFGFGINRSVNSSGVETSDYVNLIGWMSQQPSNSTQVAVPSPVVGGTYPSEYNNLNAALPVTAGLEAGGYLYIAPIFPIVGAPGNPSPDWLVTKLGYLADDTQINVTMYSTPHNYVVLNNTGSGPYFVNGIPTAILMRYE